MPLGSPVEPDVKTTYTASSDVFVVIFSRPSRKQDSLFFHMAGSPSTLVIVAGTSEDARAAKLLELSITDGATIWQISCRRWVGCPGSKSIKVIPVFITART